MKDWRYSSFLAAQSSEVWHVLQGGPKNWHHFLYAITLPNINQFSKLFHCQNQEKICNNTATKDPNIPQVCRYTTLLGPPCISE